MSQTVFGVWEIGWDSSNLKGLYLSKESAQKALIQFVNERNKEDGEDDEDSIHIIEHELRP